MATPRPKSADGSKRSQSEANAGIAGSVTAHRKRPTTIIGLRPRRSESLPASGLARSDRGGGIVRRREPTERRATITLKEIGHEGRGHWREDGGREAVEEAKREERSRRLYERVKERRTSEEETS